jgi:hypothetical protein
MKFRVRRFGDSEWTVVLLEGELAEFLGGCVGSAIALKYLHVQVWQDNRWEDLN